jgi:hypothetical protein
MLNCWSLSCWLSIRITLEVSQSFLFRELCLMFVNWGLDVAWETIVNELIGLFRSDLALLNFDKNTLIPNYTNPLNSTSPSQSHSNVQSGSDQSLMQENTIVYVEATIHVLKAIKMLNSLCPSNFIYSIATYITKVTSIFYRCYVRTFVSRNDASSISKG